MSFDEKHYNRSEGSGQHNNGNHKPDKETIISQLALGLLVLFFGGLIALCFYKPLSPMVSDLLGLPHNQETEWDDEEESESNDKHTIGNDMDSQGTAADTTYRLGAIADEDVETRATAKVVQYIISTSKGYNNHRLETFEGANELWGIKDVTDKGKVLVEPQYDYIEKLAGGEDMPYAVVTSGGQMGVINMHNEMLIPYIYDKVEEVSDGEASQQGYASYFVVCDSTDYGNRYGLVRLADGEEVVPLEYSSLDVVGPISFIVVVKDGMFGCINHRNNIIVPLEYKSVQIFRNPSNESGNSVQLRARDGSYVCFNARGRKIACD